MSEYPKLFDMEWSDEEECLVTCITLDPSNPVVVSTKAFDDYIAVAILSINGDIIDDINRFDPDMPLEYLHGIQVGVVSSAIGVAMMMDPDAVATALKEAAGNGPTD